ncbi:hypothetical protein AB0M22_20825 [Nocardia sp. NPDC051756]|uniref:hypothetical protein n=1 Tax=Nocardia sp. NPDC051756 TaxID=3154751 RepID=UPI00344293F0
MKLSLRAIFTATVLLFVLVFATLGVANATTYSEKSSGSDSITTSTTLKFEKPHGNFKLRVWVTKNAGALNWSVSDKYSIRMYDNSNRLLWSAGDQGDRTYDIGGNVTRIELNRNQAAAQQATTNWQRQ